MSHNQVIGAAALITFLPLLSPFSIILSIYIWRGKDLFCWQQTFDRQKTSYSLKYLANWKKDKRHNPKTLCYWHSDKLTNSLACSCFTVSALIVIMTLNKKWQFFTMISLNRCQEIIKQIKSKLLLHEHFIFLLLIWKKDILMENRVKMYCIVLIILQNLKFKSSILVTGALNDHIVWREKVYLK